MKNQSVNILLGAALSFLFFSCGNNASDSTEKTPDTEKVATAADTSVAVAPAAEPLPYTATKVADWTIGNPERIRTVLGMYKHYETGSQYENARDLLADSIEFISFDDRHNKYPAEKFINVVRDMRSQFKSINLEFTSYVCLHSDSLQIDMVTLWIKESVVWKDGKREKTDYLETWLFNKDGKIFRAGDYSRFRK